MKPRNRPHLSTAETISPHDRRTLVESARVLRRAAAMGALPRLLEGRNLGLLCEQQDSAEAALFERAATELGARVARISADLSASLSEESLQRTAQTLGRLYDAIECQGLTRELLRRVRAGAGIPVFDGVACAHHPSAPLAAQVDEQGAAADNRRHVVQAMLLRTLG